MPPYEENPDHVPNPLYQTGNVDTTGVTGDLGGRIENISPVFAQAKAAAFGAAVEAVEDPGVDESETVVFHSDDEGPDSREEEVENLKKAAEDAANDPQLEDPSMTPAAREAAEEGGGEDEQGEPDDGGETDPDDEDDLPDDDATKAKWIEYADDHELAVDKSLLKDDYVKAVKKAAKAKK